MIDFAKYRKAFVPLVLGLVYFANQAWGITLPVDDVMANTIFTALVSFVTYLIPNKA